MNCLITRSTLLADPARHSADVSAHLTHCPACRAFAAAISLDESLLRHAIDVTIPEHLQERILLQTQLKQRRPGLLEQLRHWAHSTTVMHRAGLAVALSAVITGGLWMAQPPVDHTLNWGEVALAHAINEPSAMTGQATLSQAAFQSAIAPYGMVLKGEIGIIRFVERCAVPGGRGTHIVIETGALGKVTLLLPPSGRPVTGGEVRGEGFAAQTVEIAGVSFGIVTDQPNKLAALTILLRRQIAKRTDGVKMTLDHHTGVRL